MSTLEQIITYPTANPWDGLDNAAAIIEGADRAGMELAVACALVDMESDGRNVFGGDGLGTDRVGVHACYPRTEVTEARYHELVARVAAGELSNGVGLTQITWPPYFDQAARQGVRLWIPVENVTFGAGILAGHLRDSGDNLAAAATLYNAGTLAAGITPYGRELAALADVWRARLSAAEDTPEPEPVPSAPAPEPDPIPDRKKPGRGRGRGKAKR